MKTSCPNRKCLILLVCLAVAVPPATATSSDVKDGRPHVQLSANVVDVQLADEEGLVGQLLDRQGRGVANDPVVLLRSGQVVERTVSDGQGRFRISGIRGGNFVVASVGAMQQVRLWAPGTAPPAAQTQLLLTSDRNPVRGQSPSNALYNMISGRPVLSYTIIGAAIVVPLVVWGTDDDDAS